MALRKCDPIWYYFHNLKNVKSTYLEVLLLVKLQASTVFRYCKWYQIAQSVTNSFNLLFWLTHQRAIFPVNCLLIVMTILIFRSSFNHNMTESLHSCLNEMTHIFGFSKAHNFLINNDGSLASFDLVMSLKTFILVVLINLIPGFVEWFKPYFFGNRKISSNLFKKTF